MGLQRAQEICVFVRSDVNRDLIARQQWLLGRRGRMGLLVTAALAFVVLLAASAASAADHDYVGVRKCKSCHITAYGVPEERLGKNYLRSEGVTCEGCHGAGKGYRKKKIMVDAERARSKGLVPQSEEVCTTCHNDESPAWDPSRYSREDGSSVGFDYEQAVSIIAHPVPEGYDPLAAGEND